jgi:histidyl-tRNA synthetase
MSNTPQPSGKKPARPTIKAVRGTRDLLPAETPLWNRVEATARAVFSRYGFGEIRTPIFEDHRALRPRRRRGDRHRLEGDVHLGRPRPRRLREDASLTLRPENTAGVVRAYIEHNLDKTGMLQKLYYIGPQFRRERPQRGRYRQFWQIGARSSARRAPAPSPRCATPRCWRCSPRSSTSSACAAGSWS